MIVRVAVEGIESTLDLDDASWTPELIQTFLRMCGDEVMRVCEGIGVKIGEDLSAEELGELLGEDAEGGDDADNSDGEPTSQA